MYALEYHRVPLGDPSSTTEYPEYILRPLGTLTYH